MILTGSEILKESKTGRISIDPFDESCLNPNSYNYHLGHQIKESHDVEGDLVFETFDLPQDGFILKPFTLYLAATKEKIGSSEFAMSLIGRSSLGRLGMFLQISANLGHTGSCHCWTLEIYTCQSLKIYPGMKVGQVSFWTNQGQHKKFSRYYADFCEPMESQLCLNTGIGDTNLFCRKTEVK
ncbi:MAG: deoxycytidine deaminase [Bdellovibrionales bacterium]|nr:deoxycytidine deaminase [Bdellovibrionales bacterium]